MVAARRGAHDHVSVCGPGSFRMTVGARATRLSSVPWKRDMLGAGFFSDKQQTDPETAMLRDERGHGGGGRRSTPRNVLGDRLEVCSLSPMTGFFRDGCCDTSQEDFGSHTVCAVMTAAFLEFSKSCGNRSEE